MTIVVGVAVPDGLILAADSRTTYKEGDRTRVTSDTTQKVFRICGDFGVSCYGTAIYQNKTVAGHMDEFEASLLTKPPADVHDLAEQLGEWFHQSLLGAHAADGAEWKPEMGWHLGFQVAGYDPDGVGALYDVKVPGPNGAHVVHTGISTTNIGVLFEGQTDVINRLIGGIDSAALEASGIEVSPDLGKALAGLEYRLLFPHTFQDAIDCAVFLIRTTIGMQRFSDGIASHPGGVPGCGGPIRVLAVSRNGSEWVARPELAIPA